MRLAIVTDVWAPLVNCIVTMLVDLTHQLQLLGHEVLMVQPGQFTVRHCPGYPAIGLATSAAEGVARQLDAFRPDAIHLATEGPLGWSARRYCLQRGFAFTTSYQTRVPEILHAQFKLPLRWSYALLRHFHRPSSAVMVPVQDMLHTLDARGFKPVCAWSHGVDTEFFRYHDAPQVSPDLGVMARPVSLFVGRLSADKNLEAFLNLDVPGTKVVCGEGPLADSLRARYPSVRWLGHLSRSRLREVFAAADVFVMPAQHHGFSLVMLEALACGLPVAAYPTKGAKEVLGTPAQGGAMDHDLRTAWYNAIALARYESRSRALNFSWAYAALMFMRHVVAVRSRPTFEIRPQGHGVVTNMSSKS